MRDSDERARDRLLAAAQEARREQAEARRTVEELDVRIAGLVDRVGQLTDSERRALDGLALATASVDQLRSESAAARSERDAAVRELTEQQSEIQRLTDQVSTLHNTAASLRKQRDKAMRDKVVYRDRLQAQYDLKWSRLGALLRGVARRPWTIVVLPFKVVRELRRPTKASVEGNSSQTRNEDKRRGPSRASAPDPRFDGVVARDSRAVLSILDEFTHSCVAPEVNLVPADRNRFELQVPTASLVFAESAWRGNDATWSFQFNKFQEGNDVDRLLSSARAAGVPTVIWNKEDPVNYELFLPVVRQFDHVLTTDADIVERYRSDLGHDRVAAMMFAAQPFLHNPIGRPTRPDTSVCFAGAWRGEKYPGRADRLSTLLDSAVRAGQLVIYDREPSQNDDGKGFPSRFHPFIKGTLTYRQMVDEYRRHACFLNVNTVEGSSTMMSRRVFEILACRTPVVSTPSRAIETHLADVVLTPGTVAETDDVVARLVHDIDHRDRVGQRGFRVVMNAHTYQHRLAEAFAALGRDGFPPPSSPSVDVICVSSRPDYLHRAIDNYRRQRYENTRLIFVTNADEFDRDAVESAVSEFDGARVMHLPSHLTLGECLNAALDNSTSEFFAKFDDDDHYGADYLSDMILATRFADATVYGKRTFHAHVEGPDCTVVRHEGHEFAYTSLVMGGTLLVRRADIGDLRFEAVPAGTDTRFLKACAARDLRIFSTDRFNYLMVRRATTSHHTWQISDEDFMSTSRSLGEGLMIDDVLI
jgi:spore maturation protein CgeB